MDFVKGDASITPENGMTLVYNANTRNYQPTGAVNLGVDHGRDGSGAITLETNHATHILGLSGPATIQMGPPKFLGQVVTLIVPSGGANAQIVADAYPKGPISLDDQDVVNFVAPTMSTWWAFGTGTPAAAPTPDTTPPTNLTGLTVTGSSDTTLSVSWQAASDPDGAVTYQGKIWPTAGTEPATWNNLGSGTSYQFTGLTQTTAYTVKVVARSAGGQSTPATASGTTKTTQVALRTVIAADAPLLAMALDDTAAPPVVTGSYPTLPTPASTGVAWGTGPGMGGYARSAQLSTASSSNIVFSGTTWDGLPSTWHLPDFGNSVTLEATVTPTSVPSGWTPIIEQFGYFGLEFYSGGARFYASNSGGNSQTISVNANFAANTAYHFMGTWDGSILSLYINGSLAGSTSFTGTMTNSFSQPAVIGYSSNIGKNLDGSVNGVAIYATALSAARALVHAQSAGAA